jgi:thiol-disulfide isomerase/thioredoxin
MKKIIVFYCFSVLIGCNSSTSQNSNRNNLELNQTKSIYLDLENNEVNLSSFKGKKILINYWATWCGPCIQEMPSLLRAQEQLKSEYVFLLASEESTQRISRFKSRKKFNFNYIRSRVSLASIGIYSLPITIIYDEEGKEIKTIEGSVVWDSKRMIKQLKAI